MNTWTTALVDAAAVAVITVLTLTSARLWRVGRKLTLMVEDWHGEPARAGVDARPGVMERLRTVETLAGAIHHEVTPNGGSSMRDDVTVIRERGDVAPAAGETA